MSPQRPLLVMTLVAGLLLQLGAGFLTDCCCAGTQGTQHNVESSISEPTSQTPGCPNCREAQSAQGSRERTAAPAVISGSGFTQNRQTCGCSKLDDSPPGTHPLRVESDVELVAVCLSIISFEPVQRPVRVAVPRSECRSPGIPLRILHCSWQA